MTRRPTVILSNDDGVAALQILAHLAYPHRPDFAMNTLLDWAAHFANRNENGSFPTQDKWSRLEPKLWRLDDTLRRRLKGAYWLRGRIAKAAHAIAPGVPRGKGLRAAARVEAGRLRNAAGEPKVENVIRDYWEQTRSVAHLGLATGDAILMATKPEEMVPKKNDPDAVTLPPWHLTRVAFRPDWVSRALQDAELNARGADRFGIIPLNEATLFVRDTF